MENALAEMRLTSAQGIKNWFDSFMPAKLAQLFWDGIHKLPERWENVIASVELKTLKKNKLQYNFRLNRLRA